MAAAAAVGWQRLAGVSGAAAVGLGAYGAHGLQGKDPTWKHIYDTASRYHLVHSAALLATSAGSAKDSTLLKGAGGGGGGSGGGG